jgi:hypothetical protein
MNAFGFICLALNIAQAPFPAAVSAIPKWEYQILSKDELTAHGKSDLAAGLNRLGGDGWELAGIDGAYIFKRQKESGRPDGELIKRAIPRIEADIAMWKERVGWAERMLRKGYVSQQRVDDERFQLKQAESALERARAAIDSLPSPSATQAPAR